MACPLDICWRAAVFWPSKGTVIEDVFVWSYLAKFCLKSEMFHTTFPEHRTVYEITVKAIPLQAWTGPEGFRSLRLPDFKTIGTLVVMLSVLRTNCLYPPPPPGNIPGTRFCYRLSQNSNDTIGNRIRGLLACSAVRFPQKYGRARRATDDDTAHALWVLDK
jgi:hypothetical protein